MVERVVVSFSKRFVEIERKKKKKKERKKSEQISEIVNRSQSFKPSPFPTREKNIYIYILALR